MIIVRPFFAQWLRVMISDASTIQIMNPRGDKRGHDSTAKAADYEILVVSFVRDVERALGALSTVLAKRINELRVGPAPCNLVLEKNMFSVLLDVGSSHSAKRAFVHGKFGVISQCCDRERQAFLFCFVICFWTLKTVIVNVLVLVLWFYKVDVLFLFLWWSCWLSFLLVNMLVFKCSSVLCSVGFDCLLLAFRRWTSNAFLTWLHETGKFLFISREYLFQKKVCSLKHFCGHCSWPYKPRLVFSGDGFALWCMDGKLLKRRQLDFAQWTVDGSERRVDALFTLCGKFYTSGDVDAKEKKVGKARLAETARKKWRAWIKRIKCNRRSNVDHVKRLGVLERQYSVYQFGIPQCCW